MKTKNPFKTLKKKIYIYKKIKQNKIKIKNFVRGSGYGGKHNTIESNGVVELENYETEGKRLNCGRKAMKMKKYIKLKI